MKWFPTLPVGCGGHISATAVRVVVAAALASAAGGGLPGFGPAARAQGGPALGPLPATTVYYGKSVVVPVPTTGLVPPVSFSVGSGDSNIIARVKTGNPWLKIHVVYEGDPGTAADDFAGDLLFQLFNDMAPVTVTHITGFAQAGYYNGLTFHRILSLTGAASGFIAQGGDPAGDGTGGPGFAFRNEFQAPLMFLVPGQLAMANSGFNSTVPGPTASAGDRFSFPGATNGSQFFVTNGPVRHLDFQHTIFGQLVRGFDVLAKIFAVPTSGGEPDHDVIMESVAEVDNPLDAVLLVSAAGRPAAAGPTTVTVRAQDGAGTVVTGTLAVTATTDAVNSGLFFAGPCNGVATIPGTVRVPFSVTDLEFDYPQYSGDWLNNPTGATSVRLDDSRRALLFDSGTTGAGGPADLWLAVSQRWPVSRGTAEDTIPIHVGMGDRRLYALPTALSATAGVPFSGPVATFRDFNPGRTPADYSAIVEWGDGTPLAADGDVAVTSVQQGGGAAVAVAAGHVYAAPGVYMVATKVIDRNGGSLLVHNEMVVGDGTGLQAHGVAAAVSAPEGKVVYRRLATFADAAGRGRWRDYRAEIDWGDGMTTPGTVRWAPGGFDVFGSHGYFDNQNFPVLVRVTKPATGQRAVAWSGVTVAGLRAREHVPPFAQPHIEGWVWQSSPVGATLDLDFEFINSGNKRSADTWFECFLSADQTLSQPADTLLSYGTSTSIGLGRLMPGGQIAGGLRGWTLPAGTTLANHAGKYVIMRVTNPDPLGDLMPVQRLFVSGPLQGP